MTAPGTQVPDSANAGPAGIDVRDVLAGVWRRRMMILVITLVAMGLGIAFVSVASPKYTSSAQVLVDNLETPYTRSEGPDANGNRAIDERDVLSQVEVIKSGDLAKRVIQDLNLTQRPDYDPLKRGLGPVARLKILLGFKADPALQTPEQRAQWQYNEGLNVYSIPRSQVIVIQYTAGDPKTAAEVANTLANAYVTSTREAQSEPTGRARDWLAEQIDDLRKKVIDSEVKVEEFRSKAGLLRGTSDTLSTQELSELNSQLIVAEAARSEAQAKAKAIRDMLAKTGSVDTSGDVLNSPLIQRLREQQVTVTRNLAELSTTYLDNHPRIKAVRQELADLDRQIRREVLKVVDRLEQDAKIASARVATLQANLNGLKAKASEGNLDDVKLRALEREAAANRTLLETFLTRYSDASTRQSLGAQPGMARVISQADEPSEPSFPKKGPVVMLATFAGLGLALGLAFMLEVMAAASRMGVTMGSRSLAPVPPPPGAREPAMPVLAEAPAPVRPAAQPPRRHALTPLPAAAVPAEPPLFSIVTPIAVAVSDAENDTEEEPAPEPAPAEPGEPSFSLTELPKIPAPAQAPMLAAQVLTDDKSAYAAALWPVIAWIESLRREPGIKRLGIAASEGRTGIDAAVLAASLARLLAVRGTKVVLLDADMAFAALDSALPAWEGPGLADLLQNSAAFSDVVTRDSVSEAQLIRSGLKRIHDGTLLERPGMQAVLDALSHVYELVLVHAGTPGPQATTLAAKLDALILAAPDRQSDDDARGSFPAGPKIAEIVRVREARTDGMASLRSRIAASI